MKASRSNHVKLDPVVPEMRYSLRHFKFLAEWEKNLADSPKLFVRTFLICTVGYYCILRVRPQKKRAGPDSRGRRLHSHRNQGQATGESYSTLVASTTVVFLFLLTQSSSPSPTALVLAFSSFFIFVTCVPMFGATSHWASSYFIFVTFYSASSW